MKKIILLLLILSSGKLFAQKDYSGSYSFQYKVFYDKSSEVKPAKDDKGRSGSLKLFRLDDGRYKFWISVSKGWPSYNSGEIDGFIVIKNNKAVFNEKNEFSKNDCKIVFRFSNSIIKAEQQSTDRDCGFGMSVFIDDDYKMQSRIKMKNAELEKMNEGYSKYAVTIGKAYLYEDETTTKTKKQYFIKKDIVTAIDEKDNAVYVEYISKAGKFIYGWLKKSDVKGI
jgi:hypothetical protein